MNLLTEWPPKRDPLLAKRKRKSIESLIREDAPKKPKGAEDGGGQISGSIAAVARARDESGPFPSAPTLHVPSPITPRSLQSPSLHHGNDDRKSPRSPDSSRRFPLSPRSRSPETRLDDGEVVNNTHGESTVFLFLGELSSLLYQPRFYYPEAILTIISASISASVFRSRYTSPATIR